jgi:hypothetical protein
MINSYWKTKEMMCNDFTRAYGYSPEINLIFQVFYWIENLSMYQKCVNDRLNARLYRWQTQWKYDCVGLPISDRQYFYLTDE